ncbi:MAG: DNA repair protein RecO [Syntrophomonas sp.]
MYYRSRVLIIKNNDFRETDKLVTVFSEKQGKLKAIAKGVKKPKSSLRACIQPFCHSELFFSKGKELDLITQGRIFEFYGNIRENINCTLNVLYIMELLDKSLMDRLALPVLYSNTLAVLDYLNRNEHNPLIIRFFEMNLLINLGYSPVFDHCAHCGTKGNGPLLFDLAEGGVLCSECAAGCHTTFSLSPESLALAKMLMTGSINVVKRVRASGPALKQLENFLEKYLEYYLERRFNMKYTLQRLKNLTIE